MTATTLDGIKILVTAGPTREPIDPVRFISNRSSGKMGYAIAGQAAKLGASVTLVSGPTAIDAPTGIEVVMVETAGEMHEAVLARLPEVDVVIKAAAVADYTPEKTSPSKIKKGEGIPTLKLVPTPDILAEIGKRKAPGQVIVGFALETEDLIANAKAKLKAKKCDMIVANDVSQKGAGFEIDTNIISIIHADGQVESLPKMTKDQVATEILNRVAQLLKSKTP